MAAASPASSVDRPREAALKAHLEPSLAPPES